MPGVEAFGVPFTSARLDAETDTTCFDVSTTTSIVDDTGFFGVFPLVLALMLDGVLEVLSWTDSTFARDWLGSFEASFGEPVALSSVFDVVSPAFLSPLVPCAGFLGDLFLFFLPDLLPEAGDAVPDVSAAASVLESAETGVPATSSFAMFTLSVSVYLLAASFAASTDFSNNASNFFDNGVRGTGFRTFFAGIFVLRVGVPSSATGCFFKKAASRMMAI